MSKAGDGGEVPPQQFDEDGNQVVGDNGSRSETSKAPTVDYLVKKLEKLKTENKKLRAKGKKATTYSSSSEDGDSNEEVIKKGRKGRNKHDKASLRDGSIHQEIQQVHKQKKTFQGR
jgi:hypothetical protein